MDSALALPRAGRGRRADRIFRLLRGADPAGDELRRPAPAEPSVHPDRAQIRAVLRQRQQRDDHDRGERGDDLRRQDHQEDRQHDEQHGSRLRDPARFGALARDRELFPPAGRRRDSQHAGAAQRRDSQDRRRPQRTRSNVHKNPGVVFGRFVSLDDKAAVIEGSFLESRLDYTRIFDEIRKIVVEPERDDTVHIYVRRTADPVRMGVSLHAANFSGFLSPRCLRVWILLYLYFHDWRGALRPTISGVICAIWGLGFIRLLGLRTRSAGARHPVFDNRARRQPFGADARSVLRGVSTGCATRKRRSCRRSRSCSCRRSRESWPTRSACW